MACDNRCTGDDVFPAPCGTCEGKKVPIKSVGYVVPEYKSRMVAMDSVRKAIDDAVARFYQMGIDDFTIEEVDSAICHEINKL
jgi:hypothetical protein